MEDEPKGFRACLIPIIAIIGAALIGELMFTAIEKWKDYIAVAIMSLIALAFLIFLLGVILGMKNKREK